VDSAVKIQRTINRRLTLDVVKGPHVKRAALRIGLNPDEFVFTHPRIVLFNNIVKRHDVPKYTLIEPLGSSPKLFLRHKTQEESAAAKLTRSDHGKPFSIHVVSSCTHKSDRNIIHTKKIRWGVSVGYLNNHGVNRPRPRHRPCGSRLGHDSLSRT
jgi:hypothetical protein